MHNYIQAKSNMITRSIKQQLGMEEPPQPDTSGLMLEAIQGIIANELSKIQKKWQKELQNNKQEIVEVVQKLESKVEQHLSSIENKM